MAVAIESGFPKLKTGLAAGSHPLTTAAFSTGGASLMVAVVGDDSGSVIFPGTISGAGLTWTLQRRAAWSGGSFVNKGGVEIWTAPSAGALSGQTVTWTPTGGVNDANGQLAVYSITGAAGSPIGAISAVREDGTGAASTVDATLTATAAGSLILGVVFSGSNGTGLALRGDTTSDGALADATSGTDVLACHATALTAGAGSVTVGSTSSKAFYAAAAIEILTAAAGPAISGVSSSTPAQGSTLTITGTTFGASQGAGSVTINGTAQTVTAWSATSIDVTVSRGVAKYGAAVNVVVTDNSLASSAPFALTGITPQSGWAYVNVSTPNSTAAQRLTASPDLAAGDQIAWQTQGGLVSVLADATWSAMAAVSSFLFEVWTSDGWGSTATQDIVPPTYPAFTPDAGEADVAPWRALLDVNTWAAPLSVQRWMADELTASASGVASLAASSVAQATATAALQLLISLTGSAAGQAGSTGAMDHGVPLAGAAAAVAVATGGATLGVPLAGAAAAQATANGSAALSVVLLGAGIAQATASGSVAKVVALNGAAAGQASGSGGVVLSIALAGAALAHASASGSFVGVVQLGGAAAAAAGASGLLQLSVPITGAAAALATAGGALTITVRLAGAAGTAASGSAALNVRTTVLLTGTAGAQATATAVLSVIGSVTGYPAAAWRARSVPRGWSTNAPARSWAATTPPRRWAAAAQRIAA